MSTVDLTINNYVATIVLTDAATRNAIDTNMVRELHRVLDAVQKPNSHVRSLVISGSGGVFCSGVDLHSVNLTTPESRQHAYSELRKFLDPLVLRFSQIRHWRASSL
jgi:enoyl-CoA hydratase/carnithine racemase